MRADAVHVPSTTCPECGAPAVEGLGCWEQLGYLLAWEAQDAELAAVHFLTVAAYNLQHPAQFDDEALAALQGAFVDHLEKGVSVAEIRRRNETIFAGARRVLKREAERTPTLRTWRLTIEYVYGGGSPARAALRVQKWAAAVRQDLVEGGS